MSAHDEFLEQRAAASLGLTYEEYCGLPEREESDPDLLYDRWEDEPPHHPTCYELFFDDDASKEIK